MDLDVWTLVYGVMQPNTMVTSKNGNIKKKKKKKKYVREWRVNGYESIDRTEFFAVCFMSLRPILSEI